jgi:hypothetical protein
VESFSTRYFSHRYHVPPPFGLPYADTAWLLPVLSNLGSRSRKGALCLLSGSRGWLLHPVGTLDPPLPISFASPSAP